MSEDINEDPVSGILSSMNMYIVLKQATEWQMSLSFGDGWWVVRVDSYIFY